MQFKKVLVTVKAYPNPSKKYGETICVAGIDLEINKWIRLYPIPYRDLDEDQKFQKYTVIEVKATKASDDKRPESYKIDCSSIKKIDYFDTKKDKWKRRKSVIMPTLSKSFCSILEESNTEDKSLGMFKPQNVNFIYDKVKPKDEEKRNAYYAQLTFYNKDKKTIEDIPFNFKYSFSCNSTPDCKGHTLSIIDWEIGQAYRSWRRKYRDENTLLEKIKERWLGRMFSEKNDTYLFVGNWKRFRANFMVLGVFYPPRV